MTLLLLNKAFIHATTYTTKKTGKTVHRKAYTDKRIAKKVVAKDRINIPSIKNKSPKEVKEDLHNERADLKAKLEEVRQHKQDLADAKSKGQIHTDKGIHVDDTHHIHKQEGNLQEKLETANHKIMLHENRYELLREKGAEAKEKRVVVRKEAQKKTEAEKKETRSQAMIGNQNAKKFDSHKEYSDWLRKQPEDVKETHKLERIDGELTALWPRKEVEKPKVEKKVVVKKDKEFLEMDKDETWKINKANFYKWFENKFNQEWEGRQEFDFFKYADTMDFQHKEIVKQALSEGKDVPAEVLKDYPDLKKKPIRISKEVIIPKEKTIPVAPVDETNKIKKQIKELESKADNAYWDFTRREKGSPEEMSKIGDEINKLKRKIGETFYPWETTFDRAKRQFDMNESAYIKNVNRAIKEGKPVPESIKDSIKKLEVVKKPVNPVAPNSDEPDKIVVSDERITDYTKEEVEGVPPKLEKEPEIIVEKPKIDWKPKVTEKDGNIHVDFSDEPAGEITIPEFKATGFTKFTKKDLEMGAISGPLQDAVNTFNREKQNIISESENAHQKAVDAKKKEGKYSRLGREFDDYHYIPPKIDAGYQIINGEPFLRLNVAQPTIRFRKDEPLPSKVRTKKKSYIIQPDGTKTEVGQSWRDEIKVQKEVYTKNSKTSAADNKILESLQNASSYSRHRFFQEAKYDPETNTIKAEASTKKLGGDPDTKISANLTVPRFLHLLAHYNSMQGSRLMSGGYVVPEKNLSGSVKDQIGIFREDSRAYGERISSSYYEAYLKGLETSFGEKNAKDTLKKDYGVRIKRQNGKEMTPDEVEMLKTVIDHTYNSMGNPRVLRKFAEDRNLKISFSGDKNAFLRKAVGLYVPTESTVVVGPGMREVMLHEMTHFVDDVLGTMLGQEGRGRGYYASEMQNSDVGMITAEGRRSFTRDKRTRGAYWSRSCEVFARMVEQYAAINDGKGNQYYPVSGYWTKEKFDTLSPKILTVLKERLGKSFSGLFPQRKPKSIIIKKK